MQSPDLDRSRTKNNRTGEIARETRKNIPRKRERTRTYDRQLDDRLRGGQLTKKSQTTPSLGQTGI